MQHVFLKMNPFFISIFFMLVSVDTALQKSGGAGAPRPLGFDATVKGVVKNIFWAAPPAPPHYIVLDAPLLD